MPVIYTRTQLKTRINAGIHGKEGTLIDFDEVCNQAAREVMEDIDLRTARRKATIASGLFTDVFDYAAPTDLKAYAIIDIPAQVKRGGKEWDLVPSEEFDRERQNCTVAVDDADTVRKLRISSKIDDTATTIGGLNNLTADGGTWVLFGDGTNLTADPDNFIKSGGSINWDISAAGGTTAGIQNTGLNQFDITAFLQGNGVAFVWHYISDADSITNYIIRLGNNSSNYYSKTITTPHFGTEFVVGWNLLRFDLKSLSEVGSVTDTTMSYAAIYMTKGAGKVSETDFRFDHLVLRVGEIYEIAYYSKYPWQNSSGTYLENSTDDGDFLNVESDEFQLIIEKGIKLASEEVNAYDIADRKELSYERRKIQYIKNNPSESKIMTSGYYDYPNYP